MANGEQKITKIVVDRNLCIGAASCVVTAGTVFELDGENKAVIKLKDGAKNSGPTQKDGLENASVGDDTLLLAAQSCPTKAIFLYDGEGKQIYP
jgi:ferredoxin